MAMKVSIISSSSTLEKASCSMNVTRQSSKRLSPILFLNLFFTKLIAEKALSTFDVATGRSNTNLRRKYTKSQGGPWPTLDTLWIRQWNRGRKPLPTAVAQLALDRGFPGELMFTPERAGEESFLSDLKEVRPELCITAAYGNILPQRFLDIPPCGTVNIHPSLLPLYRGAAPVQRALQDGVAETGVSLLYTVRALDAGPVIACERFSVDDCIKAPELLSILFNIGSKLLLDELPSVLDGSAKQKAKPQDDSKATLAPKMNSDESWLIFDEEAKFLHNKVRAFAGWPGTRAKFQLMNQNGEPDVLDIKVISTRVSTSCDKTGDEKEVLFSGNSLLIPCSGSSWLEVLELQLRGKKVTTAHNFWNGLRGRKLLKSP